MRWTKFNCPMIDPLRPKTKIDRERAQRPKTPHGPNALSCSEEVSAEGGLIPSVSRAYPGRIPDVSRAYLGRFPSISRAFPESRAYPERATSVPPACHHEHAASAQHEGRAGEARRRSGCGSGPRRRPPAGIASRRAAAAPPPAARPPCCASACGAPRPRRQIMKWGAS